MIRARRSRSMNAIGPSHDTRAPTAGSIRRREVVASDGATGRLSVTIASMTDTESLGIYHLKRLWSSALAARAGRSFEREGEAHFDRLVIEALGLGSYQTMQHLYQHAPTFSDALPHGSRPNLGTRPRIVQYINMYPGRRGRDT